MSLEPIGIFTISLGMMLFFFSSGSFITAFIPLTLLGSAGALLLSGSGTIQPAHLFLLFMLASMLRNRNFAKVISGSLTFPRECFWLTCILLFSITSAVIFPHLFASITQVNAIGSASSGDSSSLVPLGPTSGNLTQSTYMVADFFCFLVILVTGSTLSGYIRVVEALMLYAFLNIIFAILDLFTFYTGTAFLLDPIHNAQYMIHGNEVAAGGLKRITGSFTEASSFAYATAGIAFFSLHLASRGYRTLTNTVLAVVSVVLLLLSTSSTAWVIVPVMAVSAYASFCVRRFGAVRTQAELYVVTFFPVILIFLTFCILLNGQADAYLTEVANSILFDKQSSQSGIERGQWNEVAFTNFLDTYGVGTGLGSVRTSSFVLAIFSNIGFIGALLFSAFFFTLFFYRRYNGSSPHIKTIRSAARGSCAFLILAASLSGTLVDLGLPFFVYAGLACANPE